MLFRSIINIIVIPLKEDFFRLCNRYTTFNPREEESQKTQAIIKVLKSLSKKLLTYFKRCVPEEAMNQFRWATEEEKEWGQW